MACDDGPDGAFLMAVDVRVLGDGCQIRMQNAFTDQVCDGCALLEGAAEADVGAFHQRRGARFLEVEQSAHLGVQIGVGEGVGGDLVAEEVADDVFGECDGV